MATNNSSDSLTNINGGILVRSIKDYWSNHVVEGPCLIVEIIVDIKKKEMVKVCWENKLEIIKDPFLTTDDESAKIEPPILGDCIEE
ncbi:hypothetical protein Glove_420g24 [Diversispora epigaea]|uniref:Uncharacterized protein n=1 Tax=Diversispora epigaea TaxID=1348612 RepID=A0A397H0F0_9GLOM|nr:hypothetical protein Glove_420g24 [Diversispora epigaea]